MQGFSMLGGSQYQEGFPVLRGSLYQGILMLKGFPITGGFPSPGGASVCVGAVWVLGGDVPGLGRSQCGRGSARHHAQLVEGRDFGEAEHQWFQRQLFWGLQWLQSQVLQDGAEEQEQLHSRQTLTQAQTLPCRDTRGSWGARGAGNPTREAGAT